MVPELFKKVRETPGKSFHQVSSKSELKCPSYDQSLTVLVVTVLVLTVLVLTVLVLTVLVLTVLVLTVLVLTVPALTVLVGNLKFSY